MLDHSSHFVICSFTDSFNNLQFLIRKSTRTNFLGISSNCQTSELTEVLGLEELNCSFSETIRSFRSEKSYY